MPPQLDHLLVNLAMLVTTQEVVRKIAILAYQVNTHHPLAPHLATHVMKVLMLLSKPQLTVIHADQALTLKDMPSIAHHAK